MHSNSPFATVRSSDRHWCNGARNVIKWSSTPLSFIPFIRQYSDLRYTRKWCGGTPAPAEIANRRYLCRLLMLNKNENFPFPSCYCRGEHGVQHKYVYKLSGWCFIVSTEMTRTKRGKKNNNLSICCMLSCHFAHFICNARMEFGQPQRPSKYYKTFHIFVPSTGCLHPTDGRESGESSYKIFKMVRAPLLHFMKTLQRFASPILL